MREYAQQSLMYKCGNLTEEPSRFIFWKRWQLEKTLLNYNNQKTSMFLVAYRAFVEALAKDDRVTLKKMTERNVY